MAMTPCHPTTLDEYKAFLCSFICSCSVFAPKQPQITGTRALKQACMDGALQTYLDMAGGCVVPEVPYVMTDEPTSLYGATGGAHTQGLGKLVKAARIARAVGLGQAKAYIEDGTTPPGKLAKYVKGDLRIPDTVIMEKCDSVNTDRANIAYVIEVKFNGDRENEKQNEAYEKIAPSADRYYVLKEKNCACAGNRQNYGQGPAPDIQPGIAAVEEMEKNLAAAGKVLAGAAAGIVALAVPQTSALRFGAQMYRWAPGFLRRAPIQVLP